jgi:hypothetical protein
MQGYDHLDEQQRQLIAAVLKAACSVIGEEPYVGKQRAHEWALSGRLGIWLSRQVLIRRLERYGIRVDLEYDQMADGDRKMVGDNHRRIDVLVHRRGREGPNLLACEVKPNEGRPPSVDPTDLDKLLYLTRQDRQFRYRVGMWLSLPRENVGSAYYAVIVDGRLLDEDEYKGIHEVRKTADA